jgi:flagellar biosynthetic protein FliR
MRLVIALGLAGVCLPILSSQVPHGFTLLWLVLAVREILVGIAMGFVAACWFRAAETSGRLIDAVSGYNASDTSLPVGKGGGGPFTALTLLLAVVVFLELGGIGHVTVALVRSYDAIPLFAPLRLGSAAHSMTSSAILASAKLITATLGLCAPVWIALFLADVVLAFVGRSVSVLPVYSLGLPLKALLGVGIVLLGLGGIQATMQGSLADFLALMRAATEMGR